MVRYPGMKSGKFWKQEHDSLLLHAVLKYAFSLPSVTSLLSVNFYMMHIFCILPLFASK
jgi:hypothetical protein